MLFQRKTPKKVPSYLQDARKEDEVDDVAMGLAGAQQGGRAPPPGNQGGNQGGGQASFGPPSGASKPKPGPPYQTVTLEAAPGVMESVDWDKLGGVRPPPAKSQEDLIAERIRDLLEQDDRSQARSAMDEALRQATAESRLAARARTGIAGMGLTGAAAAAEGTEARRGERERTMALDEFDRRARAEELQRLLAATDELRAGSAEERAKAAEGRAGAAEEREKTAFERVMDMLAEEETSVDAATKAEQIKADRKLSQDEAKDFEAISLEELNASGGGEAVFPEGWEDEYNYTILYGPPQRLVKTLKSEHEAAMAARRGK